MIIGTASERHDRAPSGAAIRDIGPRARDPSQGNAVSILARGRLGSLAGLLARAPAELDGLDTQWTPRRTYRDQAACDDAGRRHCGRGRSRGPLLRRRIVRDRWCQSRARACCSSHGRGARGRSAGVGLWRALIAGRAASSLARDVAVATRLAARPSSGIAPRSNQIRSPEKPWWGIPGKEDETGRASGSLVGSAPAHGPRSCLSASPPRENLRIDTISVSAKVL